MVAGELNVCCLVYEEERMASMEEVNGPESVGCVGE